jgi:hypothetical protein
MILRQRSKAIKALRRSEMEEIALVLGREQE